MGKSDLCNGGSSGESIVVAHGYNEELLLRGRREYQSLSKMAAAASSRTANDSPQCRSIINSMAMYSDINTNRHATTTPIMDELTYRDSPKIYDDDYAETGQMDKEEYANNYQAPPDQRNHKRTAVSCSSSSSSKSALLLLILAIVLLDTGSAFLLDGSQSSFAQFRKWYTGLNGTLELEFKSDQPNGLVLYTDDGGTYDFIELKLVEGVLRLRFNLGGGAQIITVGRDLHDGHWHKVQVNSLLLLNFRPTAVDIHTFIISPGVYTGVFAFG